MTPDCESGHGEYHIPVMRDEVLWMLRPRTGGTYVDCTVGGGGHAASVLERVAPGGFLVGIDRDQEAIEFASRRLSSFEGSFTLVCGNFADLKTLLRDLGIGYVDGVLFDLGASSRQFDDPGRGFSYMGDALLDMRMDTNSGPSARDLVNTLPFDDIARIIREYGEERWASRIARFIVARRESRPITTTGELADIIKQAVPARARRTGPHPARRTFQALRIAVNNELDNLEKGIDQAVDVLRAGGRLVAISFHSLEDRIVKKKLSWHAARRDAAGVPGHTSGSGRLRILTTRPLVPSEEEVRANARSRSAKLRAAEKF